MSLIRRIKMVPRSILWCSLLLALPLSAASQTNRLNLVRLNATGAFEQPVAPRNLTEVTSVFVNDQGDVLITDGAKSYLKKVGASSFSELGLSGGLSDGGEVPHNPRISRGPGGPLGYAAGVIPITGSFQSLHQSIRAASGLDLYSTQASTMSSNGRFVGGEAFRFNAPNETDLIVPAFVVDRQAATVSIPVFPSNGGGNLVASVKSINSLGEYLIRWLRVDLSGAPRFESSLQLVRVDGSRVDVLSPSTLWGSSMQINDAGEIALNVMRSGAAVGSEMRFYRANDLASPIVVSNDDFPSIRFARMNSAGKAVGTGLSDQCYSTDRTNCVSTGLLLDPKGGTIVDLNSIVDGIPAGERIVGASSITTSGVIGAWISKPSGRFEGVLLVPDGSSFTYVHPVASELGQPTPVQGPTSPPVGGAPLMPGPVVTPIENVVSPVDGSQPRMIPLCADGIRLSAKSCSSGSFPKLCRLEVRKPLRLALHGSLTRVGLTNGPSSSDLATVRSRSPNRIVGFRVRIPAAGGYQIFQTIPAQGSAQSGEVCRSNAISVR